MHKNGRVRELQYILILQGMREQNKIETIRLQAIAGRYWRKSGGVFRFWNFGQVGPKSEQEVVNQ